ncbi:MAG: hypothetical protein MUC49_09760 [Raineya sp.]|jgi:hypothetical protein|nr:hypothetical protein [Raineya sp.]
MREFKKIDLIIQIVLLALCILAPLTLYFITYMIILLPALGLWQLSSLGVHAYKRLLTKWHKIYLITLAPILLFMISAVYIFSYADRFFTVWIVSGYVMGIFYTYVSYKTLNDV